MKLSARRWGVWPWLQLLMLLAIVGEGVSLARSAAASEILDEQGLQLDLGDTPRCVIWPRRLQLQADCAGIDLGAADNIEASNRSDGARMRTLAMIVWKPAGEGALLSTIVSMPPAAPTSEFVSDYLAGIYNSLHSPDDQVTQRDDPRLHHETLTLAGAPAIRYSTKTHAGSHLTRSYLVFGEKRTYAFGFVITTANATRGPALAEALLATIDLSHEPVSDPISATFIGTLLGALLLTGILSRFIWSRSRRTLTGALAALAVTGTLCVVVSLTLGVETAFPYLAGAGLGLVFERVASALRARNSLQESDRIRRVHPRAFDRTAADVLPDPGQLDSARL